MRLLTVIKSVRTMVFSGKSLIYDTKKVLPKISYLHTAGAVPPKSNYTMTTIGP